MAITRVNSFVQWAAANSKLITSATEVVSDEFAVDATTVLLGIQLSADNSSTPVDGDTAKFKIQWSTGDILEDTGNDFDTSEHAEFLATLDTFATNTPGEDPARRTIWIPPTAPFFKIGVTAANAATRNITVRVRVTEQRAA